MTSDTPLGWVGPVLIAGPRSDAVVRAIEEENSGVEVHDRGAYLRVRVRGRLAVTAGAIGRQLGRPFELPADLESLMSSFQGSFRVTSGEAVWSAAAGPAGDERDPDPGGRR